MGLNAEVRNFFTNRINAVLDAKEAVIRKVFNKGEIEAIALDRLCRVIGIDKGDIARFEEIEAQKSALEQEEDKLRSKIRYAAEQSGVSLNYYRDIANTLRSSATSKYEQDILAERYPFEYAELAKLRTIREDVQGVVLLATSEPKLVKALTKVLVKYGGDISELTALIPEQE